MGAIGAIAPTAKNVGAMPSSRPPPHRNFCYTAVVQSQKVQQKIRLCHYESEKGSLISA